MKKYIDIEHLGSEENKDIFKYNEDIIIIEEKEDGGNGSMFIDENNKIHFCTRNRDLTTDNDIKTFQGLQIQLTEHLKRLALKGVKLNPDYIYYFEWMQRHTIPYTNAPFVIGLDIRLWKDINGNPGAFLTRELKEKEFERIELELAPLVWKGTAREIKTLKIEDLVPKSKYYDGLAEGIVIKNYSRLSPGKDHQIFAKVVREQFKESNKIVFGNVKNKSSDTRRIMETYATSARIRKLINKLVNEENLPLHRNLMKRLPVDLIKDILKEKAITIFENFDFLDFGEMKGIAAKYSLNEIDNMLRETIK